MSASSVQVLINKQKSKVLFMEANNDFVDYLLSFLTFPLGEMVHSILRNTPIGSIDTLQNGLSNLDGSHFCVAGVKGMLLNPATPFREEYCKLSLRIANYYRDAVFICRDSNCKESQLKNVSMYRGVATCDCGKPLNRDAFVECEGRGAGGVFIVKPSSFIITDDLLVAPIDTGILQTLDKLGITDIEGAHLIPFELNNVITLFKLSLFSATPLTDLILKKGCLTNANPQSEIFLHHAETSVAGSRKMVLKVVLRKSTNEFLFGEAGHEFVEFLFSFLAIPLGGVVSLLGGNTCFKSIDNFFRSVTHLIDNKFFVTPETKTRFMNPKVARGYLSENQILPLAEQHPPKLFYKPTCNNLGEHVPTFSNKSGTSFSFKTMQGKAKFLRKQSIFFVDDDLTVTPSFATNISVLNNRGIPLWDLKEMEFHIGLEEALRILRISLTSKKVLTDALIEPLLRN